MDRSKRLAELNRQISRCKKCPLHKTRKNGVPGEGPVNARFFFIGQAPGREEDRTGRPFVGRAGKLLDELLKEAGLKREKVFITSCLKSFPPDNRKPKKSEIDACLNYTIRQIEIVNPEVIVLLGKVAQDAFLNEPSFKERVMLYTYHPAAALRFPKYKKALLNYFSKTIKEAAK